MHEIYLDHAATTRVRPEVVAVVNECLTENYGNPSSPHAKGLQAEAAVRRAREHVAQAVGVSRDEVIFTSGGTESNNLAIKGALHRHRRHPGTILCSAIEHPSILEVMAGLKESGFKVEQIPVDARGVVRADRLAQMIDHKTQLVSIACVNNEIGTIQDIAELVRIIRSKCADTIIHTDAVQALGKIPVRPWAWGVDLLSLSGHKIGALKGVGALVVRRGLRLHPLVHGGQQESGARSGTENVPGIAAFGEAARLAVSELQSVATRLGALRQHLIERVQAEIPEVEVLGPTQDLAAPHIVNLGLPNVKGEVMVRLLSEAGLYVSTGSACSSKKRAASHVIASLGVSSALREGSLRVSLGPENTKDDVEEAALRIVQAYHELAQWVR